MSRITTTQFVRKPLYVDAVRITGANFDAIAAWCQGEVQRDQVPGKGTGKKYIKVRVHNPKNARQTKAFVGDWLLYTERGYKVYTNKAFRASFDEMQRVEETSVDVTLIGDELIAPGLTVNEAVRQLREQAAQGKLDLVPSATVSDDQIELVPTTPEEIAEAGKRSIYTDSDTPAAVVDTTEQPENVETVPQSEPIEPVAAEGKRVLSIAEQKELTAEEVRELVQSGEVVLAQDIAAA